MSWVQGAWNCCPLPTGFPLLTLCTVKSRFKEELCGDPKELCSGQHLLKGNRPTLLTRENCLTAAERKEEAENIAQGFRKKIKWLPAKVSLENVYLQVLRKTEMAKWFDADTHNPCPSPHKTSTAAGQGLSSLWGASSLLLCWLEVKLLTRWREKPLSSWQLSYSARMGWERRVLITTFTPKVQ